MSGSLRWLCFVLCALALTLSGCCNAFSGGDDSAESNGEKKKSKKKKSKKKKKKTASKQQASADEDKAPEPPPERSSGPPPPAASVDDVLARLADSAGCTTGESLYPHWCMAAQGWQSGTVDPLPERDYLVGYAIPVTATKTEMKTMRLTALTLRSAGGRKYARIIDIRPDNDKEKNELAQVVASVGLLFRGKTPTLRLGGGLDSYLRGEAKKASYPVTKGTSSWLIASGGAPAQLRKVGPYWVAVEPKGDLNHVSIVSDRIAVD